MEKAKKFRSDHEIKIAIIGLSGFFLSTLIILWALVILIRFYIFEGPIYTFFTFCMLTSGEKSSKFPLKICFNLDYLFRNHFQHVVHQFAHNGLHILQLYFPVCHRTADHNYLDHFVYFHAAVQSRHFFTIFLHADRSI